jgi:tetratricopeptide (TPR) repeat protein
MPNDDRNKFKLAVLLEKTLNPVDKMKLS